jgi:hypothetical protein
VGDEGVRLDGRGVSIGRRAVGKAGGDVGQGSDGALDTRGANQPSLRFGWLAEYVLLLLTLRATAARGGSS